MLCDPLVLDVLHAHWGHQWQGGSWSLACPNCGHDHIGRFRRSKTLYCVACYAEFTAQDDRLPHSWLSIPEWVIATYLVMHGASVRQVQLLPISHKTALGVVRFIRSKTDLPAPRARRVSTAHLLSLLKEAATGDALTRPAFLMLTTIVMWDVEREW